MTNRGRGTDPSEIAGVVATAMEAESRARAMPSEKMAEP